MPDFEDFLNVFSPESVMYESPLGKYSKFLGSYFSLYLRPGVLSGAEEPWSTEKDV